MRTTSASGVKERAARWTERGIAFLHAPVFMGPRNALESTGLIPEAKVGILREKAKHQPVVAVGDRSYILTSDDQGASWRFANEPRNGPLLTAAQVALYPMRDTLINRAKCSAKLLDLMVLGCPIVTHRVGQQGEYLQHGESAAKLAPVRGGDDSPSPTCQLLPGERCCR